ncbi:MAG: hypothetical protein R2769_07235 [Saprospiraceae bacterium]
MGSNPTVGFVTTLGTQNEAPNARQFDIQVESQNFSSNFSLDVNVTGGTAEPGDQPDNHQFGFYRKSSPKPLPFSF